MTEFQANLYRRAKAHGRAILRARCRGQALNSGSMIDKALDRAIKSDESAPGRWKFRPARHRADHMGIYCGKRIKRSLCFWRCYLRRAFYCSGKKNAKNIRIA